MKPVPQQPIGCEDTGKSSNEEITIRFKRYRWNGSVAVLYRGKSGQGGHPAAESADGSNLMEAVTENYRPQGQG